MADTFREELVTLLPRLRAYAIAVTGGASDADDLVQDTLVRAWRFRHSYQPGSNMKAWVFKILRNTFYTAAVAKKNTVQDVEGKYAAQLTSSPDQEWRLQYGELMEALDQLPAGARDALLLVVGSDMSYEEAAEICGCPVGTMKSRVNRARERLAALMGMDTPAMRRRAARRANEGIVVEFAPFAA